MADDGRVVQILRSIGVISFQHAMRAEPAHQEPGFLSGHHAITPAEGSVYAAYEPIPKSKQLFACFQQYVCGRVTGQKTRALMKLQKVGNRANHASDALDVRVDEGVDFMAVHELESLVADFLNKGMRHPCEEWVGWSVCIDQVGNIFVMVAGYVYGLHAGEAIQKASTSGDDTVERTAEQLKEITDDDKLSRVVMDVIQEGAQEYLAISLAQIVSGRTVANVQITYDEDRSVMTDLTTLS
jgi:hypothetical protein